MPYPEPMVSQFIGAMYVSPDFNGLIVQVYASTVMTIYVGEWLTHWSLGHLDTILKMQYRVLFY